MSDLEIASIPRELAGLSNRQSANIISIFKATSRDLQKLSRNVKREKDIQNIQSELDYIVNTSVDKAGLEMYKASFEARKISVEFDINRFKGSILPKVDYDAFSRYLIDARKVINLSLDEYLTKKSYVDGRTLEFRLQTIKRGTSNTVEAILRNGLSEGKGAFDIAKDINQYIRKDNRTAWTSPWHIMRKDKGFPLSSPYTGKVPAGSVDYNALRIARTEIMNNYRWARIDATRNKDWVIGWAWRLSHAHPKEDICDEWAAHDEGLGVGVYSNPSKIAGLGHPNDFCQVITVSIFDDNVKKYFDRAEKLGLISPQKYSILQT